MAQLDIAAPALRPVRPDLRKIIEYVIRLVHDFHRGAIAFEDVPAKTNRSLIRYTPSFISGAAPRFENSKPWTTKTLALYMNSTQNAGEYLKASQVVALAVDLVEQYEQEKVDVATLSSLLQNGGKIVGLRKLTKKPRNSSKKKTA